MFRRTDPSEEWRRENAERRWVSSEEEKSFINAVVAEDIVTTRRLLEEEATSLGWWTGQWRKLRGQTLVNVARYRPPARDGVSPYNPVCVSAL
jgi:hypothetical protein